MGVKIKSSNPKPPLSRTANKIKYFDNFVCGFLKIYKYIKVLSNTTVPQTRSKVICNGVKIKPSLGINSTGINNGIKPHIKITMKNLKYMTFLKVVESRIFITKVYQR